MSELEFNLNPASYYTLQKCYYDSADISVFAEVGAVQSGRILLKNLVVSYLDSYTWAEEKAEEEHAWIYETDPFTSANIQPGDHVRFDGSVDLYKRKDGSPDYGIKVSGEVEKVSVGRYMEQVHAMHVETAMSFVNQIRCETCLYYEQCDGMITGICLLG